MLNPKVYKIAFWHDPRRLILRAFTGLPLDFFFSALEEMFLHHNGVKTGWLELSLHEIASLSAKPGAQLKLLDFYHISLPLPSTRKTRFCMPDWYSST